ncbi:MAG: molybdate ABC transporter substrate-binding protein [Chloroflexota bacterium]|nr:molybdate ABC transporter substrate-binding protein [Chloroflexota bacterium]
MRRYKILTVVFLISVAALLAGCNKQPVITEERELLIYCGSAMAQPMEEIAAIIEKQENCKVTIKIGGSGNLLATIQADQVGDLYLPGDDSYIVTCLEQDLVIETTLVGYNKLALMVQEGNPLGITADPASLTNEDYVLVLGDPDKMSAGREAQKILANMGILDQAMGHVHSLAANATELTDALKNGEADLTINWYATSTLPENAPYVDALPISEEYAARNKLVLGLLSTSEHPELARKFMAYATSDAGQRIFDKYGLYDVE